MRRIVCALLVLPLLLCTGCLKAHSLDRYGYVSAIGFDRGKEMPYKITLMLQNMHLDEGSQTSEGFTLVSAECRDLYEAIETLSANLPYALDFSRTMVLTFAQELMREEGVLEELLNISFSRLYIRYNANVYVALGEVAAVYEGMKNKMEPNMSKILINHMLYSRSTGLVPVANLTVLQEAFRERYEDAIVPVCGTSDKGDEPPVGPKPAGGEPPNIGGSPLVKSELKTGLAGSALFSGSRMVGLLDGPNTQLLLMALGEFQEGRIRLGEEKDTETSLYVKADGKPKIELSLGEKPTAAVTLRFNVALEQPELVDAQELGRIARELEEQLEKNLRELFFTCRTLQSDAMGFGRQAVKQFTSSEAWHAYDWPTVYQRLDASFTVTVAVEQAAGRSVLE